MTTFEVFFGFTGTPFSRDIAVNQLLETESGKEMLGRLNYVRLCENPLSVTGLNW